jgi:hypothetical protein
MAEGAGCTRPALADQKVAAVYSGWILRRLRPAAEGCLHLRALGLIVCKGAVWVLAGALEEESAVLELPQVHVRGLLVVAEGALRAVCARKQVVVSAVCPHSLHPLQAWSEHGRQRRFRRLVAFGIEPRLTLQPS